MNNFSNKSYCIRLQYEDWAFCHGFTNEVQVALVADFLQGVYLSSSSDLCALPNNISLPDSLRAVFVNAGRCLASLVEKLTDSELIKHVGLVYNENRESVNKILGENMIMPGTGDCRGACKYNTGDRSMYRNYGWS